MPYNIYVETSPQVSLGHYRPWHKAAGFKNTLVKALTDFTDIDKRVPAIKRVLIFCIISDMDRTFAFLASLFRFY